MSLFSDVKPAMTIESIASKLIHFESQLQFNHWNTQSYAEHMALGSLYEYVHSFRDGVIEKLMGYMQTRLKAFPIVSVSTVDSQKLVMELCDWSYALYEWAGENDYCDVENLAQELSGEAAKAKYLLTLS
jgi:hypothetical protein